MRRRFSFNIPTLLLCLSVQIQTVGSFLLCLFDLPSASNAYAAGPPTTISGTPSGVGGLNTLVNSSPTSVCSANCVITGGTRPGGGANLFHSFGQFNIGAGDVATFQNGISFNANGTALPAGLPTSNILARITGTNGNNPTLSSIYGALQTSGFGNANLFLINPAGFLFGPNATVNVGGMVAFTSADYLRLQGAGGDGIFYANSTANSVLTTAPVSAYGFLGSNPGAITVQGSQLSVTPGQNLSLVGGNITIQSGTLDDGHVQPALLSASGGQINLASVASPGEILAGTMSPAPNINGQSFGVLGNIQVLEQSHIDASGNGGGAVLIRGGNLLLDNSTISANVTGPGSLVNGTEAIGNGVDIVASQDVVIQNGAVIETNILGNATPGVQYGGVHVKADRIEIIGTHDFVNFPATLITSDISAGSTGGSAGNINLEANSILMQDFGTATTVIESVTQGAGKSGNISLKANQNIEIDTATLLTIAASASADAGNIELSSVQGNISLLDQVFLSSQTVGGIGTAGTIALNAPAGTILTTAGTTVGTQIAPPLNQAGVPEVRAAGSGGVLVNANNLQLSGGTINVLNLSNQLPGGITINLSGSLTLNASPPSQFSPGPQPPGSIEATTQGPGGSSGLSINATHVLITDGGRLTTSTLSSGAAGPLNISATSVQLTNGGHINSGSQQGIDPNTGLPGGPPPTGPGGTVTIHGVGGSTQSVLIDGQNSGIFTNTVGTAAGGNILMNANSVMLQNGGSLSAATSGASSSATGGTITVNANQLQVNSGGLITAATTGAGAGGTVNINAANKFSSNAGTVSSTASQSTGGNINIAAGNSVTLTNGASISASSTGQGSAGDIHINAGNFTATNSSVTTEANQSSGGIIKITTSPAGTVQLTDSKISASVLDGSGGGGSVNIDPQYVILDNSQIIANSVFGPGGNINITTNLLLPDSTSIISASSQFGQQGNIVIQSPVSPASGKIIPLGQKPLIVTTLLGQRCAALAGGNTSSFTMAGRDALPVEPGALVSTPLPLQLAELSADGAEESISINATGVAEGTPLLSLRRIAPPGFLTQSFAPDVAGCAS